MHGGDDAGRRADPQDVLARQQRRDAQARRLVLPDYVVAPCKQKQPMVDLHKSTMDNGCALLGFLTSFVQIGKTKISRKTDYQSHDLPERTLLTTPDTFTSAMHSRLTTWKARTLDELSLTIL